MSELWDDPLILVNFFDDFWGLGTNYHIGPKNDFLLLLSLSLAIQLRKRSIMISASAALKIILV
jgi:hypothetical protein